MKHYGRIIASVIAGWFVFALSASALHLFANDAQRPPLAVGLAASVPILLFAGWYAGDRRFRELVLALNPRLLTFVQSLRILGLVFVILESERQLPVLFGRSAGYGDIFIGLTASLVAVKLAIPRHRNSFIVWNVLGITDLITAVFLGTTAQWLAPHGASMFLMTVLPLSLIPTFLVPLFFILHVIAIAQARRWQIVQGDTSSASVKQLALGRTTAH